MITTRDVGPIQLELLNGDGLFVRVTRCLDIGGSWTGVANFPGDMEELAVERIDRVSSDNDVEALLREFADEETWLDFQEFRKSYGV